ncbi:MAG: hypothetical protein M0R50_11210 [Candidatus Cloacimonetes bacterium]|jgi:hypothetical protein|nr:hypothetical protein [Candidatus Cloacimonadota bacterium]
MEHLKIDWTLKSEDQFKDLHNSAANERHGGFIHRIMPPIDWHCGDIPQSCYDKNKGQHEICNELYKSYLSDENVNRLVKWLEEQDGRADSRHTIIAKCQLEVLVEIDADTIWRYNQGLVEI